MKKPGLKTIILAVLLFSLTSACSSDDLADGFADGQSPYGSFHTKGWTAPTSHGAAWMADMDSCSECHAVDLSGGTSGVSCDSCHYGWKTRCDFCHGGGAGNLTPAPDSGAHLAHVKNIATHLAYGCDTCHAVPESVESEGHLDAEPGAEVIFPARVGESAAYANGSCTAVYCHGGADVSWAENIEPTCASCHGYAGSSATMSGDHSSHLARGLDCGDCHAGVAGNGIIRNRALHTDGAVSVDFAFCPGGECAYDSVTKNCTQSCHSQSVWGGAYHPEGWTAPNMHAYAFERAEGNACSDCHGSDLAGGSSGVSCDQCHSGGTDAWKRDCTFCHGGSENSSGAPPEGVFGESLRSQQAVGAHTAHVQDGPAHVAYACDTCHPVYSSMSDEGHINQQRVVVFSSLNGNAEYKPETAGCSALYCHGDGRDNSGTISWTSETAADCSGCHGYYEKAGLSGKHAAHLGYNLKCSACHKDYIDDGNSLLDKSRHIDGNVDVKLSVGQWNETERNCTATCHEDSSW